MAVIESSSDNKGEWAAEEVSGDDVNWFDKVVSCDEVIDWFEEAVTAEVVLPEMLTLPGIVVMMPPSVNLQMSHGSSHKLVEAHMRSKSQKGKSPKS